MLHKPRLIALALSISGLVAGCGSGGGSGGGADSSLTFAVTDAASDDLATFVVDITSVRLTRLGGGTVGVLPRTVNLDLVSLQHVSQVLNVVNVPPGLYTSAEVTIDFTNATAQLVDEPTPASIVDGDGLTLTGPVTFPITIGNLLNAIAGRNKILELDFDLNQSLTVDTGTNTVFVEPALVLRVDRNDPKELIIVGVLEVVDESEMEIEVEVQTLTGATLTDATLEVDAQTVYQIDGVPFVGAAGLSMVAAMPAGTWIQAHGAVVPQKARLDIDYFEIGTGTYNGGSDIVEGYITGRTGGAGSDAILTVLGFSDDATHTSFQFNTSFTVQTDFANTKVLRRGASQARDVDDLNVGQRVRMFGTLSGMTLDASGTMDVIRLQPTRILGFAEDASSGGVLDIDLDRVGLRDESLFTWADGGTSPTDSGDVHALVGNLDVGLQIGTGTAVELVGFFTAVDDDTEDFIAATVVNRDLGPSLLVIHDRLGGLDVTMTVNANDLTFTVSGSPVLGEIAIVDRGFIGPLPLPTSPDPTVTPAGPLGFYIIHDRATGAVTLNLAFDAFGTALSNQLGSGAILRNFGALGPYDAGTNSISSGLIVVVLD